METPNIIDTSAFIEGKTGLITVFTAIEHPKASKTGRRVLFPSTQDYVRAMDLSEKLTKVGTRVGAVDVLIASMAINRFLAVTTKDRDFEKIQAVEKKLKIEWVP